MNNDAIQIPVVTVILQQESVTNWRFMQNILKSHNQSVAGELTFAWCANCLCIYMHMYILGVVKILNFKS